MKVLMHTNAQSSQKRPLSQFTNPRDVEFPAEGELATTIVQPYMRSVAKKALHGRS